MRQAVSKLQKHAQVTHDTSTFRRLPSLPGMILYVILKVSPSENGVVQTVQVTLCNCWAKSGRFLPREELDVGVQRLVLVVPQDIPQAVLRTVDDEALH